MRSIKGELEQKRNALRGAIHETMEHEFTLPPLPLSARSLMDPPLAESRPQMHDHVV